MIKAVIFDLDGVLIDSEELHFLAYKAYFAKKGAVMTEDEYRKLFGITGTDIFKIMFTEKKIDFDDKEIEKALYEKNTHFRELVAKHVKREKPTEALLDSLKKAGYKIGMATSALDTNVDFIKKHLGLEKYFDAIVTSADITHGKPHPEIFLKTAEKLKTKPEECVVVEDSNHGLSGAKAAGMKTIAVTTTHPKDKIKNADRIIKDVKELNIDAIRRLE